MSCTALCVVYSSRQKTKLERVGTQAGRSRMSRGAVSHSDTSLITTKNILMSGHNYCCCICKAVKVAREKMK